MVETVNTTAPEVSKKRSERRRDAGVILLSTLAAITLVSLITLAIQQRALANARVLASLEGRHMLAGEDAGALERMKGLVADRIGEAEPAREGTVTGERRYSFQLFDRGWVATAETDETRKLVRILAIPESS